jgi:hypothetical protein
MKKKTNRERVIMKFTKCIALALLSTTLLSMPATTTAQEPAGHLLSIFEMHVKAGHNDQLKAGIAAWKQCYLAQKGDRDWNTWQRQQGQGNVYVVAFRLANWAALDTPNEAAQKCQSVVAEQITPHVHAEKGATSYARLLPEISRNAPVSDLIWVNNFKADDARLMRRTIDQVVGAMAEAEGQPRAFWYSVQGGDAASADYFAVTPFENFAALDETRTGVWEVITKLRGEDESERLRNDFRTSLDSSWAYLFRRMPELSHNP